MRHEVTFAAVAAGIKALLKHRNETYADLAERIGMSESGVKKLLTAEDASFARLSEICAALDLSLVDLVEMAARELPPHEVTMPLDVQEHFLADPECFYVYCALAYERASPDATMALLEISSRTFWKHVRQLDRFGMLILAAGDRIHIPRIGQHVWVGGGPFLDDLLRRWACEAAAAAVAHRGVTGWHINVRTYRLSATARAELERELKRLHAEYQTRSMREELSMDRDALELVRFISVLAPGGFLQPRRP